MLRIKTSFSRVIDSLTRIIIDAEKPFLMSIVGASCSGKSYLASCLRRSISLHGIEVSLINLDHYYRDKSDPLRDPEYFYDSPSAYRSDRLRDDIRRLLQNKDIMMPRFDKSCNKIVGDHEVFVSASEIIIVEGLFAIEMLKEFTTNQLSLFLDVDEEILLKRRLKRDHEEFKVNQTETMKLWHQYVVKGNQMFVLPQRDQAQLVIKTIEEANHVS